MKEVTKNQEDIQTRIEIMEWTLVAQVGLIMLFIFLLYLKGQNTEHLHTILTGSIFVYDFKRYQKAKTRKSLISLLIWSVIFVFSLVTTLQLIGSL